PIPYAGSASCMRRADPSGRVRRFWCVGVGLAGAALLGVGDGGVAALRSFIVVAAVPVGFVMLPTLWTGPRVGMEMAAEQGITGPRRTAAAAERASAQTPGTAEQEPAPVAAGR